MCDEDREEYGEQKYMDGHDAAFRSVMTYCMRQIVGTDGDDQTKLAGMIDERGEAIRALRELCEIVGCNDWPDSLHLADIIEKHLGRAVREELY